MTLLISVVMKAIVEAAGLSKLARHRIFIAATNFNKADNDVGVAGVAPQAGHPFEQAVLVDPDVDLIEEGIISGNVNLDNPAITCTKADGNTDIQAPNTSDVLVLHFQGTGNTSGNNNISFVLRGTVLPDDPGTSADDISGNMSVGSGGGNGSSAFVGIGILPAGRYLTLVRTGGTANNSVVADIDRGIAISEEALQ